MKPQITPPILAAILAIGVSMPAMGQEAEYLRFQLESQMSEVDRSASELLDELLLRPKEARDSAIIVAQHPALIVRLRYADRNSPATIARIASEYPADVSEAATLLARHPDTLALLADHVVSAGILGRVYAESRATAVVAMDRLSEQAQAQAAATSAAWQRRLGANAPANSQLAAARQAFTSQRNADGVTIMTPVLSGGPGDLPPATLVSFVLERAEEYADLGAELIDQWENERNPEGFRRAVDIWYAHGRDVLPWTFSGSSQDRARLLREYDKFRKAAASFVMEVDGVTLDRIGYLLDRAAEFPMLTHVRQAKLAAVSSNQRPTISGSPYTSGRGSGSSVSRSSGRSSGTMASRTGSTRSTTNRNSRQGRESGEGQNQGGFDGSTGSGFGGSGGGFGGGGFGGGGGGGFGGGSGGFGTGSTGSSSSSSSTNRLPSSRSGSSSSSDR